MVHAAGESSPGNLPEGTYAVVLGARHVLDLRRIAMKLKAASIPFVEIVEPDAPYTGQLMAIGVKPCLRSIGRRVLSSLPLYRGPTSAPGPASGTGSKPTGAPIHGGVV
jgi:hypothetical protein